MTENINMKRYFWAALFTITILFASVSHSALVTTTLTGVNVDCIVVPETTNCNGFIGINLQLDISFDDSLYGTIIQESDIQSLALTQFDIPIFGTSTFDYATEVGLNLAALEIDATGNIVEGFIKVNPLYGPPNKLINFNFFEGGTTSPLGNAVNLTSYLSDGTYLAGACFDGYACSATVPLPAGAWLFLSALSGLAALQAKK